MGEAKRRADEIAALESLDSADGDDVPQQVQEAIKVIGRERFVDYAVHQLLAALGYLQEAGEMEILASGALVMRGKTFVRLRVRDAAGIEHDLALPATPALLKSFGTPPAGSTGRPHRGTRRGPPDV